MMKTKKFNRSGAYFSLPLYWQGIKKLRIPGIAMAITVIGLNLILPITTAASDRAREANYLNYLAGNTGGWGGYEVPSMRVVDSFNEFAPVTLALLVFAPLLAFLMFSYLNDRGKSDFYHSIPQTRLCAYISFSAAMATWVSAVLLATTAINLVIWSTAVYHTMMVGEILSVMACVLLGSLFTMAVAAVAMTLSGTTVSNLFVAALVLLAAPFVYWEYLQAMYDIVPVFNVEESWTRLLLLETYYPFSLFSAVLSGSSRYSKIIFDGGVIAYTIALTLGLWVGGGALYHFRRSEMANQSAPNRTLQHIYRCAITLPLLLWPILDGIQNGFDESHLWVIFLALLLYIIYELSTVKRIKPMLRSLPLFGALIVACVAIYGSMYLVHFAVEADVPGRSQVKTVAVDPAQLRLDSDLFETSDMAISDERAIALVMEALEFSAPLTRDEYRAHVNRLEQENWNKYDYYATPNTSSYEYTSADYSRVDVEIKLKGGRVLHRSVWMEETKWNELKNIYFNSEMYRKAYLSVPTPSQVYSMNISQPLDYYTLSSDKWPALYDIFYAEYTALSQAQQKIVRDAEQYSGNEYLPRMVISSTMYDRSLYIYAAPDLLPKTFALICEYELDGGPNRKQDGSPRDTLPAALDLLSTLKITDVQDINAKNGDVEIKYDVYIDLQLHAADKYVTAQDLSSSKVTYYHVSFDSYGSKTTTDGRNHQFDRMQAAVAVLRGADDLQDYDNPTKKAYFLQLSWSNFPSEIAKEQPYLDIYTYITLTPTEAAAFVSAMGYAQEIVDTPVLE